VAEPFAPSPPGTALSDCARWKPSEIPSWPVLFMSASAAIADPLLRSSSLVAREACCAPVKGRQVLEARRDPWTRQ
jgi:hypothetical protein